MIANPDTNTEVNKTCIYCGKQTSNGMILCTICRHIYNNKPCHRCENRTKDCHARCIKYAMWRRRHAVVIAYRQKKKKEASPW